MKKGLVALLCLVQILYWIPGGAENPRQPVNSSVPTPESPRQLLYTSNISPQQFPFETHNVFLPLVSRNIDGGFLWSSPVALTLEPLNLHDPSVVLDARGRLHVFWDTRVTSGKQYIYHISQAAQGWTGPQVVAESQGSSELQAQPIPGPDGSIQIVWYNALSQEGPYRLLFASWVEDQWSAAEELFRWDSQELEGRLNFDAQGNPHVAILAGDGLDHRYYHLLRTPSGWTGAVEMDPAFWRIWVLSWSPWPDRSGGVRFYGAKTTDPAALSFLYWKDNRFQDDAQPFPGTLDNKRIVLDRLDNLHLSWTGSVPIPGGSVNGLAYQCLDKTLTWRTESVLSGQSAISGEAKAGWDGETQLAFAWRNQDSQALDLSLVEGCPASALHTRTLPQLLTTFSHAWTVAAVTTNSQPEQACALLRDTYSPKKYFVLCAVRVQEGK